MKILAIILIHQISTNNMINTLPKSLIEAAKKILTESIHPMIDVDGEMKHRHNSNGIPIHHSDEGIKNFHRWFGDSKAVDEHGRPKVFYHGTDASFDEFKPTTGKISTVFGSEHVDRHGHFFTDDKELAKTFSNAGNTMSVYLKMHNPLGMRNGLDDDKLQDFENHGFNPRWFTHSHLEDWERFDGEDGKDFTNTLGKMGHDSAIIHEPSVEGQKGGHAYVVFHPNQIKSAIGNNGDFHPKKPQINESVESQIHTTNSLGMPIHKTVEGVHNFNKWFDGSKVKDDHGRPLVVYHGTNAHVYSGDEEIDNFHTNPESGRGAAFFTSNKSLAHEYGQKVYHTYLKLKNPLIIDAQGKHWSAISHNSPIKGEATDQLNAIRKQKHNDVESVARDMSEVFGDPYTPKEFHPMNSLEGHSLKHIPGLEHDDIETDQVVKAAKKNGFDGVIFHNVKDSPTHDQGYRHDTADVYAVFHPQHIKSTDNNGQFGTEWHQGIKE